MGTIERMYFGPDGATAEVPEALKRRAEIESRKAMIAAQDRRAAKRKVEAAKRKAAEPAEARERLRREMDADPVWSSRLAAHEAGHSLAFLLEGLEPGEVGIRLNESARLEGYSHGRRGWLSTGGALAGIAGERILCGDGELVGADRVAFERTAREGGRSPDLLQFSELPRVEALLRSHLGALRALRDQILLRGSIPGPAVEKILTDALTVPGREAVQRARLRTGWLG